MFQRRQPKKIFSKKPGRRLPISLIIIGLLALLLFLVPTYTPEEIVPPASFTPQPSPSPTTSPAPPPTYTPAPLPTGFHGGRVIFTCTRGDYNHLCMVNQDGSGLLRLTDDFANDYYPAFSPLGGAISFASNRSRGTFDLYFMVLSTSSLIQLTDEIGNAFSPDFSPEGERVVFANSDENGQTSLYIVDRTGENLRLLFEGPNYSGPTSIVGAAWSPDGRTIAFAMSTTQLYEYEIFLINADGTEPPQQLNTGLLGITGSLDWSPDGRSLLISAGPPGDKDIFRLDLQANVITRLTYGGNNNSPSFSPDGEYVAYNSLRNGGQADIYLIRADGTDERQLTNHPEPDWQPQWEP
ncbi:MAG: PD40 domain-containing protein [Anaerolineales bacterium]|nr:PD40 domain-containing protein [Anaerolineales bacterium]